MPLKVMEVVVGPSNVVSSTHNCTVPSDSKTLYVDDVNEIRFAENNTVE